MVTPAPLDVDALLDDPATTILVCCGSGGVGKTTTAATLGVRAAQRGRRVCVLTIDPARRLAQSLGLAALDNTPREVSGVGRDGGALFAMMLDMKRTFDEIVQQHADPGRAQQILENPLYQSLSSSFAGTQEYMAMEKLGQLHREAVETGEWDLVIVDTPPSRSALDFLDAPERLGTFLDGRFVRILLAPARAGGKAYMKVFGGAFSVVTGALNKILGAQLLADLQTLVAGLDSVFGGFRERAERTYALLQDSGDLVPRRRRAGARCAARGVLLRRAAAAGLHAARRAGVQPRAHDRGTRRLGGTSRGSSGRPRRASGAQPDGGPASAARRHDAGA